MQGDLRLADLAIKTCILDQPRAHHGGQANLNESLFDCSAVIRQNRVDFNVLEAVENAPGCGMLPIKK